MAEITIIEEPNKNTGLVGKIQQLIDLRGKKFHKLVIKRDEELNHLLHVTGYDAKGTPYYVVFVDKRE